MALCNASHMHHTLMGLTWNLNASVGLVKLSSLQNWLDIRDKCFVIFRDISILFLYIFHRQHYILYSIVCGFVHVDGFPLPSPWHEMEENVLLNLIDFIYSPQKCTAGTSTTLKDHFHFAQFQTSVRYCWKLTTVDQWWLTSSWRSNPVYCNHLSTAMQSIYLVKIFWISEVQVMGKAIQCRVFR